MLKFSRKIASRLSKNSNGYFVNLVYELADSNPFNRVEPKLDIKPVIIEMKNHREVYDTLNSEISATFKALLNADEKGVIAIFDNRVVGNCFVAIGKEANPRKINEIISLKKGEAYIHYCDTAPNHRRKGIYSHLLFLLVEHAFNEEGAKVIYIDTLPNHIASRKGIEKIGFRKSKLIKRFKVFGKILIMWPEDLHTTEA